MENTIVSGLEYVENTTRINWTYLHGKLEEEIGYDIYTVANCTLHNLQKGIYSLNYNGKSCLLYYWITTFKDTGLVVYEDDLEANIYAKSKYEEEATFI